MVQALQTDLLEVNKRALLLQDNSHLFYVNGTLNLLQSLRYGCVVFNSLIQTCQKGNSEIINCSVVSSCDHD